MKGTSVKTALLRFCYGFLGAKTFRYLRGELSVIGRCAYYRGARGESIDCHIDCIWYELEGERARKCVYTFLTP